PHLGRNAFGRNSFIIFFSVFRIRPTMPTSHLQVISTRLHVPTATSGVSDETTPNEVTIFPNCTRRYLKRNRRPAVLQARTRLPLNRPDRAVKGPKNSPWRGIGRT